LVDAFTADRDRSPYKRFDSILDEIETGVREDRWDADTIEDQYCEIVSKSRDSPQEVTDAEIATAIAAATVGTHTDILGVFYQLSGRTSDHFDQFFTPPNVAEGAATMAAGARENFNRPAIAAENVSGQSSFDVFADGGAAEDDEDAVSTGGPSPDPHDETVVFDPACGSGRLLLAGARVTAGTVALGWDAAYTAARMTAITLALTRTPGWVVQGDSTTLDANTVWRIAPSTNGVLEEFSVSGETRFPTEYADDPEIKPAAPELTESVSSIPEVVEEIQRVLSRGVDLTVANPPFGNADIKRGSGSASRTRFDLARKDLDDRGSGLKSSVGFEWLMFELAADVTLPTGAVCFIVPMSALSAPSEKQQRRWLRETMYLTASVELPSETFAPETKTRTGMLTAIPRTEEESGISLDYEVYMAIVEQMGHGNRATGISMTTDDGDLTVDVSELPREYTAHRWLGKSVVTVPDDDVPAVIAKYLDFNSTAA